MHEVLRARQPAALRAVERRHLLRLLRDRRGAEGRPSDPAHAASPDTPQGSAPLGRRVEGHGEPGTDEYGDEYEDVEYESLPTHFPAKVETYVEVDAIANYLVDVENLDDSGASAF